MQPTTRSPLRNAGWAAVASGLIGVLAYASLVGYLITRSRPDPHVGELFIRAHDIGVILQFLLLIPVVSGLYINAQLRPPSMSRPLFFTTVGALFFTAIFLILIFPLILADALYMFPQGIFGVCLIFICRQLTGLLPRTIRWFGMIVGFGLTLVGIFPLGYSIFVDPVMLRIPIGDMSKYPFPTTISLANNILHKFIWIGSFMGVLTLPFWTLILGIFLLRKRRLASEKIN
jgi:hypothetical protein